ncbi:MAG: DUF6702 family protein [Flavobacteriales bacterium Tduv]
MSLFGQGFNISTTDIEIFPDNKLIKASIKLSTDRLGQVLQVAPTSPQFEKYLKAYVEGKFNLRVNGKPDSLYFIGKKVDEKVTWVDYEIEAAPAISDIKVFNGLLIDRYPDQRNVVNFNIKGVRKTVICEKSHEEQSLSF